MAIIIAATLVISTVGLLLVFILTAVCIFKGMSGCNRYE